ncbi:TnpV protein [Chakrabartyella piscis]|uniref:TnpV protein n=1 Tax=Chakrabartyella piscis TaxID=2918914 RepID=UPI002958DAFB|nr:TnpV protein [Chakrabartyella piscis]
MEQSIFEKMGGTYIKVGDYYVPNLGQFEDEEETDDRPLGKYGMLRRTYLEEHRKPLYNHLLLSGELHSHLRDVNEQAQQMIDTLLPQYKAKQCVTEELKAREQLLWVGMVNNIIAQIEEIIFSEIVYV